MTDLMLSFARLHQDLPLPARRIARDAIRREGAKEWAQAQVIYNEALRQLFLEDFPLGPNELAIVDPNKTLTEKRETFHEQLSKAAEILNSRYYVARQAYEGMILPDGTRFGGRDLSPAETLMISYSRETLDALLDQDVAGFAEEARLAAGVADLKEELGQVDAANLTEPQLSKKDQEAIQVKLNVVLEKTNWLDSDKRGGELESALELSRTDAKLAVKVEDVLRNIGYLAVDRVLERVRRIPELETIKIDVDGRSYRFAEWVISVGNVASASEEKFSVVLSEIPDEASLKEEFNRLLKERLNVQELFEQERAVWIERVEEAMQQVTVTIGGKSCHYHEWVNSVEILASASEKELAVVLKKLPDPATLESTFNSLLVKHLNAREVFEKELNAWGERVIGPTWEIQWNRIRDMARGDLAPGLWSDANQFLDEADKIARNHLLKATDVIARTEAEIERAKKEMKREFIEKEMSRLRAKRDAAKVFVEGTADNVEKRLNKANEDVKKKLEEGRKDAQRRVDKAKAGLKSLERRSTEELEDAAKKAGKELEDFRKHAADEVWTSPRMVGAPAMLSQAGLERFGALIA